MLSLADEHSLFLLFLLICHQVPEIIDTMGELYQMTEWRLQTFPRLAQLLGRLDLLLSQVRNKAFNA